MKFFWYVLFILVLVIIYIFAFFRNAWYFLYNITHKRKRPYWDPALWLMDDEFDVTERYYHD